jgi:dienelactone hydrolase
MDRVAVHLVEATVHGRVLMRPGPRAAAGALVGFHGYAEHAAMALDRLRGLPGSDGWTLIAIQGLNRFYRGRSQDTVAGWMTREDRETAIADNIHYVDAVLDRLLSTDRPTRIVALGFSQGVAMAFRTAVCGRHRCDSVIAAGGDVPPELLADPASVFPAVLLVRGEQDDWYTAQKLDADASALRARAVHVSARVVPGAHEWNADVDAAVGEFLELRRHAAHG